MTLTGLVIDHQTQKSPPWKPVAILRLFQDVFGNKVVISDIQLRDPDHLLPIGKMFIIFFDGETE